MILPVRAPPEEIFPERLAQQVDHPNKCRSKSPPVPLRTAAIIRATMDESRACSVRNSCVDPDYEAS
jgi:hypothetical protein